MKFTGIVKNKEEAWKEIKKKTSGAWIKDEEKSKAEGADVYVADDPMAKSISKNYGLEDLIIDYGNKIVINYASGHIYEFLIGEKIMAKVETYVADAGNLKLTHGDVSVSFANRYGDGQFYVTILDNINDEDNVIPADAAWEGVVEGSWDIEQYDCGTGHPIAHINGKYAVYSHKGDMYVQRIG